MFQKFKFFLKVGVGSILLDFCIYITLLFICRLISRITQGWLSFGLHNFVGINFSVISFRAFLNSVHLVLVSDPMTWLW